MTRVLDVGCHDSWLGKWLHERYGEGLHIDGIELYPEAAEKSRLRGVNCKIGAAEDAPRLFKPGTYDAVVAMELIEHVVNPEAFLTTLEQMLAPGGHLYLSTPDGTFGLGSNPHHLRVYRSIDLADLCRRRGHLEDFLVGEDGIACASYTPQPRLGDVAIYCGPCWDTWGPADITTRGLGGSETAAVRLGEQLSELGYVVTVYGQVNEGAYKDVLFRDHRTFDPMEPRQAVISSRAPWLFDRPVIAAKRLLWGHDIDFGAELTQQRADSIDHVLALSSWHLEHLAGRYPFLNGKLARIRNGIETSYFNGAGEPLERRLRVAYTSSPDRGLDVLLEEWPQIREAVPEATLAHCYSPVYHAVAAQDPVVGAHAARIRELSKQEGVQPLGALSQPKVAVLMRSSMVWSAPSWNSPSDSPFFETFCIGACEAQAGGAVVVASDWGALSETVKTGRLVPGPGGTREWRDRLVSGIVAGLTDPDVQARAQAEGPKVAAGLGWAGVARQVAGLLR